MWHYFQFAILRPFIYVLLSNKLHVSRTLCRRTARLIRTRIVKDKNTLFVYYFRVSLKHTLPAVMRETNNLHFQKIVVFMMLF